MEISFTTEAGIHWPNILIFSFEVAEGDPSHLRKSHINAQRGGAGESPRGHGPGRDTALGCNTAPGGGASRREDPDSMWGRKLVIVQLSQRLQRWHTLSHTGRGEPSLQQGTLENFALELADAHNSLLNSAQVPRSPQAALPPGSLLTFITPGQEYKWRPTYHKSKYLTAKNQTLK